MKKLVLETTAPFQGLPELVAYDEGLFAREGLERSLNPYDKSLSPSMYPIHPRHRNLTHTHASVPVPTFVSLCSTRACKRRNQRDTSKYLILVWLWI